MTPLDFGSWLEEGASKWVPSQFSTRAQIQSARIQDKQTDITLRRGTTMLEPQTVRIEYDDYYTQANSALGSGNLRKAIVFGVRGHPTLDDTDIKVWDTFVMDDVEYTVTSVNTHLLGQVQAYVEAVG